MDTNGPKKMTEFEEDALRAYQENVQAGIDDTEEALEQDVEYNSQPIADLPDAPTWGDIDMWRKQYPDSKVYRTSIVGDMFVFRTIIRGEYKVIVANPTLNAITREEVICRTCCLWPQMDAETIGKSQAGTCSALSKLIMELSGFTEPEVVERLV